MNYFQGNNKHPRHLSVGAVLTNDHGEICVHHVNDESLAQEGRLKGYWTDEGVTDFYILMRETIESNEALEKAKELFRQ